MRSSSAAALASRQRHPHRPCHELRRDRTQKSRLGDRVWRRRAVGDHRLGARHHRTDRPEERTPSSRPFRSDESARRTGWRYRMAVGEGAIWVLAPASLWRIDSTTRRFMGSVPLGHSAEGSSVATGDGAVWVASREGNAAPCRPGVPESGQNDSARDSRLPRRPLGRTRGWRGIGLGCGHVDRLVTIGPSETPKAKAYPSNAQRRLAADGSRPTRSTNGLASSSRRPRPAQPAELRRIAPLFVPPIGPIRVFQPKVAQGTVIRAPRVTATLYSSQIGPEAGESF